MKQLKVLRYRLVPASNRIVIHLRQTCIVYCIIIGPWANTADSGGATKSILQCHLLKILFLTQLYFRPTVCSFFWTTKAGYYKLLLRGATTSSKFGGPIPRSKVLYPSTVKIRQVYPVWCSWLHNHTLFIKKLRKKLGGPSKVWGVYTPRPQWLRPCHCSHKLLLLF